ncbi:MAG: cytochrome c [Chlorobiaceae bacterium]|nr:cytochrome c [Chlorobiaceae bacterium]NTW10473.1 cytochrome c [Chlorobiaceae bacterium]
MQSSLLLLGILLFSPSAVSAAEIVLSGTALYNKYCSVCHTLSPPAANAPSIKTIAALYRRKYQQKTEGVARIAAFVKLPSVKNALDQDAILKYGLMSRVPASQKETQAVAEWLWEQAGFALIPVKGR